jgi:hypothetical protein
MPEPFYKINAGNSLFLTPQIKECLSLVYVNKRLSSFGKKGKSLEKNFVKYK